MTDSFEAWINGMTEEQYADWIEDKATEKQEEKALNIRTPLSESEMSQIEREQEYSDETSNIKQVDDIVYDNRDLPPVRRDVTIEIPRDGAPIKIVEQKPVLNVLQRSRQLKRVKEGNLTTIRGASEAEIQQIKTQLGTNIILGKDVRKSQDELARLGFLVGHRISLRTRLSNIFNRFRRKK